MERKHHLICGRTRTLAMVLSLQVLVVASPSRSWADETPRPAPLSESLSGDAKADYDSARILFEAGNFAGASSKFRQAYDRAKDPRLLWNVAVCEKGLQHYARVQSLTQRYLDEGKDVLTAEQDKAARDLLAAVKGLIGSVRVAAPDGAEISVDGERVGVAPLKEPLQLDLGPHKLSAQKAGMQASVTSVEVAGGTETNVTIVLRPMDRRSRISVQAGEGDAIAFDGIPIATTRWQAEVDAGTHTLRVTAPQRKPYEVRLDLLEGATRTVDVSLEAQRPLWHWIAGGAVLATAATIGGYFLFKPEAKPGEQTLGSLGGVNLARWGQ
jgi:hypothetical protein